MQRDFVNGLTFWWHGWEFLFRHRSLLAYAVFPFVLSVTSTGSLLWILWSYLPTWMDDLVTWVGLSAGLWHDVLYYPILVSAATLTVVSSIYVAYAIQLLVAWPFYSLLADRALSRTVKKNPAPPFGRLGRRLRKALHMLRVSLLKTVLLVFIGTILFMLSFIPGLNLVTVAAALLILASDCMDYSFEAIGFGFRERVSYLCREWPQWFGMAAGLGLTLFLPGLTLLVIPGAVVGAANLLKLDERSNDESRTSASQTSRKL